MQFKFTQTEVEGKLSDCLKWGDQDELAKLLDKTPGYISQQVNPNDERESDIYKAAKFICAVMEIDQCRGVMILQLINLLCERHITVNAATCPNTEASSLMSEFSEAVKAHFEGKSDAVKIKEIDDVIRQAQKLKDAIKTSGEKAEIAKNYITFHTNDTGANVN